jgi:hypothetical protein
MATTVKMNAIGLGGTIFLPNTGQVTVGSDGTVTILSSDIVPALQLGMTFVNQISGWFETAHAPAAASATVTVANVAAANGALTIAAQPDYPRPLKVTFAPGAAAVTAGACTLVYTANDGTTVTDVLSLVTGSGVSVTPLSTKSVAHLTSATVAALVGGSSPTIEIGTIAAIGVPVAPGFQDFAVYKENVDGADETVGTVNAVGAYITPTTAPNGSHLFGFGYTYNAVGS